MSILGPSGCGGKSTLLRAIAGLEPVAAGEILVGERSVEGLAPKDREVAFVFQSYALYPHMSCRDNLAASLLMRELSGGQRQRSRLSTRQSRRRPAQPEPIRPRFAWPCQNGMKIGQTVLDDMTAIGNGAMTPDAAAAAMTDRIAPLLK